MITKLFSFGWPKKFENEGFCWTNFFSENKILNLLENNLTSTLKDWRNEAVNNFEEIMFYNYRNKKVKKLINNIFTNVVNKYTI